MGINFGKKNKKWFLTLNTLFVTIFAHTFHLKSGLENTRTELVIERRTGGTASLIFITNLGVKKSMATSGHYGHLMYELWWLLLRNRRA